MTDVKSTDLKVITPTNIPEFFVDGPMSITKINDIAVLTMSRIRPNPEQSIRALSRAELSIEVACRITMPSQVLRQMADMLSRHEFVIAPPAGRA